MRFCECVKAVQETPVKVGDFGTVALREEFIPDRYHRKRYPLTAERYLFEVNHQCWAKITSLSEQTRDELSIVLAREEYPVSLYLKELGWVIIFCEGTIRDLLFSRFREYFAAKEARRESR